MAGRGRWQSVLLVMAHISLVCPSKSKLTFTSPNCQLSCSDDVTCSIVMNLCSRDNHTSSKDIPSAPTDLKHSFTEERNRSTLLLTWKPPNDGSYLQLHGFEVMVHEQITGAAARCYYLTPQSNWTEVHAKAEGSISFFLKCIQVNGSTNISVSVTSLPMDLNRPRNISSSIEYKGEEKKETKTKEEDDSWGTTFTSYAANYSDILLLATRAHPNPKIKHFDVIVKCGNVLVSTVQYVKPQEKLRNKERNLQITPEGGFMFHVPGPFPEDTECALEVDYRDPLTGYNPTFYSAGRFNYSSMECWEPLWNPRLKGSQTISPMSKDVDNLGNPLTHFIMERPIFRAMFYHLQISERLLKGRSQRWVLDEIYKVNQTSDKDEHPGISVNKDGDWEFVVYGLLLEKKYTYSMKALDSDKKPLLNVKQIENEPLVIVAKRGNSTVTIEPVIAPAMDNRMKIVLGLIIAAFLMLLVTMLGYCFSHRLSARLRSSGGFWRPNNSQGLKILPIYCSENEHYQEAVKRHVNMIRQYACASYSPIPDSRGDSRPHCWSSVVAWLLARNQETIGKDMEAEIKSSEIIIYLSPGLVNLMVSEPTSLQPINSCDSECQQLLSALYRLHCRGLGKRPHLVTFDCFDKAELVCLDTFHWMAVTSRPVPFRHPRSHGTVSFKPGNSSHLANIERQAHEHVQILYNHSSLAETDREQTGRLMPPLVLAAQVSGFWRLQNMYELLARLRDYLDYPDHQRLSFSMIGPPEGWRTSPETQAIENHIQQAAKLFLQSLPETQTHFSNVTVANPNRDHETSSISPVCNCASSFSSTQCLQQCNPQNEATDNDCNETLLCTLCGKIKFTRNAASESLGKNSDAFNLTVPSNGCDTLNDYNTEMCLESTPNMKRVGNHLYSDYVVSYQECQSAQFVQNCDVDSVEFSGNDCRIGFPYPHHEKFATSSAKIKVNATSCSDLNQYSNSNSYSPLFDPRRVILPPLPVNVTSELDKHPLGFSQDIIPPDRCRSKSGFTLERMAQLNADSGWSEENLDMCN